MDVAFMNTSDGDAVVERIADSLGRFTRLEVALILAALKPGDRLPSGLVAVPEEPWHFLAVCKELLSPENADRYFGANPSPIDHANIVVDRKSEGNRC